MCSRIQSASAPWYAKQLPTRSSLSPDRIFTISPPGPFRLSSFSFFSFYPAPSPSFFLRLFRFFCFLAPSPPRFLSFLFFLALLSVSTRCEPIEHSATCGCLTHGPVLFVPSAFASTAPSVLVASIVGLRGMRPAPHHTASQATPEFGDNTAAINQRHAVSSQHYTTVCIDELASIDTRTPVWSGSRHARQSQLIRFATQAASEPKWF